MEMNEIIEIVEEYILQNIGEDSIEHDYDIFEDGLMSSLFTITLMTFIEKQFNIKVTMEDLDIENFNTINHISEFIKKKLK